MGILYIVSTPIGNLEDITIRAVRTLFCVDVIACEDTRRTGLLLHELKKKYPLIIQQWNNSTMQQFFRLDDHTEMQKTPELIVMLENGKHIALVSDAGTPLISDPGFLLVRETMKRGIKVISIPGTSAVLTALTSSGLPCNNFLFLGYPPETPSKRVKLFSSLLLCFKTLEHKPTIIFYCAPHKLIQTLKDMKQIFGDIEITVARELTKVHEEVMKRTILTAVSSYPVPKGEMVLLFRL